MFLIIRSLKLIAIDAGQVVVFCFFVFHVSCDIKIKITQSMQFPTVAPSVQVAPSHN